ncbi:Pfs domain protein [Annulohypoxylon nitens]|nr:Pfs domain protein [Annulohypoxylon nitens]
MDSASSSKMADKAYKREDYTIGWICTQTKQQTAAIMMLDEIHHDIPKQSYDPNTYTLGSMGPHNVVIACRLSVDDHGPNTAATAVWMTSMFSEIRLCMLIGLASGIPSKVKLGDIVVGIPNGRWPGVLQWERGETGGYRKDAEMDRPPSILISALTKLQSDHELWGSRIPAYLAKIGENERLAARYLISDSLQDHENPMSESRGVSIHYGMIANTSLQIRDEATREEFNLSLGGQHLLCINMDSWSLMPKFPCIVIRGISNYADGDRDDYEGWKGPAAAVAAAFAKEVLAVLPETEVVGRATIKSMGTEVL